MLYTLTRAPCPKANCSRRRGRPNRHAGRLTVSQSGFASPPSSGRSPPYLERLIVDRAANCRCTAADNPKFIRGWPQNISPRQRPHASSDATSAKPQSSSSTPSAAAAIANQPLACPTSPSRSTRPAASSARPRAAVNAICWPPDRRRRLGSLSSTPARACPPARPEGQGLHPLFGTLGKSDAIAANALARNGRDRYAELWSAREPERERLQALVLARRDRQGPPRLTPIVAPSPPLNPSVFIRGARRKLRG